MVRQAHSLRGSLLRRNRGRLLCEVLEERCLLNCGPNGTVLEDFDGDLSAYKTIVRYYPSAMTWEGAGCDGGQALVDYDGDDWMIRRDAGDVVSQGDTISAWVYLGGVADGRAYLGFGSIVPTSYDVNPPTQARPITTGRTLSVVLAPNTNQFQIQQHLGYKFTTNNFAVLGTTNFQYTMDAYYRVEVTWAQGGGIQARLYDSEGNELAAAAGQQTASYPNTSGGLAFRAFGAESYAIFDSIVKVEPGGAPGGYTPPIQRANIGVPVVANRLNQGPSTQGAPNPFLYTSTPGTDRDIQLDNISGLTTVSCTAAQCPDGTFGGMIGLTVTNRSRNMTNVQVPWGPSLINHFSNDTPLNTPNFQSFIYRREGGKTVEIGESGIKAFWSSTDSDYQHIGPLSTDTYATSHNANRSSFSTTASLNPYTGERYDYSEMGDRNIHGLYTLRNRSFTSPFENLLQAHTDDLNPLLHPGAEWYMGANIYVVGDRDVTNNSRWLRYNITRTGENRYSFTPVGSQQLDLCTIPDMPQVGRCAGGSPGGAPSGGGGDNGQVYITTILAQPVVGFVIQPLQQSPGQLPPVDGAALVDPFADEQPLEQAPFALEPAAVATVLNEALTSDFGQIGGGF